MAFPRVRVSYTLPLALAAGLAVLPAGCGGGEGVTKYDVPKATDGGKKGGEPAAAGEYRMLGAMFPADNPKWFFKYSGTVDEVAKNEAGFDELLKSVKTGGAAPLEFTPPKGWERGPGRDGFVKVFATVKPPEGKGEVTITQSAGGVEMNLGRWVGQVGLKAGADDRAKYTTTITTAGGEKGLRVDLKGPNNPETKRGGPMMPAGHP